MKRLLILAFIVLVSNLYPALEEELIDAAGKALAGTVMSRNMENTHGINPANMYFENKTSFSANGQMAYTFLTDTSTLGGRIFAKYIISDSLGIGLSADFLNVDYSGIVYNVANKSIWRELQAKISASFQVEQNIKAGFSLKYMEYGNKIEQNGKVNTMTSAVDLGMGLLSSINKFSIGLSADNLLQFERGTSTVLNIGISTTSFGDLLGISTLNVIEPAIDINYNIDLVRADINTGVILSLINNISIYGGLQGIDYFRTIAPTIGGSLSVASLILSYGFVYNLNLFGFGDHHFGATVSF